MNRPVPTALKIVTGNPGKRPLPQGEPQPEGAVVIPKFVTGKALEIWHQYAPGLEKSKVLTSWDVDMFGAWCCLMAEFQKSPRRISVPRIAQMRALASSFGLTPADRARIKVSGDSGNQKDADRFYA